MCTKLLAQSGIILAILSVFSVSADTLTMTTHDFTLDWHPIRANTYPAQLVTRLTTERLVEKVCIGDEAGRYLRGRMTGGFLKVCLSDMAVVQKKFLSLNDVDPSRCPGLSVQDFVFTLDQIAKDITNDYNYFKLAIKGNRLFVGYPNPPRPKDVRQAISFPILRVAPNANREFRQGSEEQYNALTYGRYEVESFETNLVRLQARNRNEINMTAISLKYFNQRTQLVQSMGGKDRVDVVLDLPISISVNPKAYKAHTVSELNNVSYVGFNFKSQNKALLDFYNLKSFRQLFTFSIWATNEIRNQLNIDRGSKAKGIFYGESFEANFRDQTRRPRSKARMVKEIRRFLVNEKVNTLTQVKFLIPPNMSYFFTETQINNFVDELNELWQTDKGYGLKFVLLNPGLASQYKATLESGKFDMVIDTLFYGRNPYKAMALLLKGDPLNYLGNELIAASDIKVWLMLGEKGLEPFRQRVLDTYPVAIIGSFPRRDYISSEIEIPESRCPQVSIPYTSMHNWKKR